MLRRLERTASIVLADRPTELSKVVWRHPVQDASSVRFLRTQVHHRRRLFSSNHVISFSSTQTQLPAAVLSSPVMNVDITHRLTSLNKVQQDDNALLLFTLWRSDNVNVRVRRKKKNLLFPETRPTLAFTPRP